MPPRVSILLPFRDAESTLEAALASCLDQTFGDFELIAVDDRSTDRSRAVAEQIASSDPRIVLVDSEAPGGLVAALQTAHRASRGELLARMDADDVAYPDRLADQAALLDSRPEIAACGCRVRIVGSAAAGDDTQTEGPADGPVADAIDGTIAGVVDGSLNASSNSPRDGFARYEQWINSLTEPDAIARERFVESPLVHPTALMRRGAFETVGGYCEVRWAEDYDLWLRMLEAGMQLAKVPRVLLDWSDRPARLTRTDERYSEENFPRAKAHYLARMETVRRRGAMISGAGPIGKRMARLLAAEGVEVHGFLEIHRGRVGETIGGVPVLAAEDMPRPGPEVPIQLAAVGQPGRREAVTQLFAARGFTPGVDFFAVA